MSADIIEKGGWVMKYMSLVLGTILALGLAVDAFAAEGGPVMIENGKKVKFDYTLTVEGKVMDTSEGKAPLEYVQGSGNIIPGLEKQMAGLKVGDERTFNVKPEEAYGQVDPAAFKEMPKSSLPKEFVPEVGKMISVVDNQGRRMPVTISEVKEQSIMINLNHPLAGKDLEFKIKVIDIQ